jgi:class 3 adenylate cyclase/tetratricopeptide (TPR) repeat protein
MKWRIACMEAHSELRLVTSLFVDVVGSTDATVRLGPERMQRLLGEAFAQLSTRIEVHGGVVEKYIGDAVLGTFGIPISHPNDAEQALRAADACARWASEWTASGGLSIRAGLETGQLLVDPRALETSQRMVIGESINLAARLQSHAEPGEIVVGPGCHEATADVAVFEALGGLDLKGLGSVEAWRFTGFRDAEAAVDIEFVGRAPELATLRGAFEAARAGSPELALIVGPPGQGKSRLAREAIRRASSFRVLEARCRPEAGANSPLRQLVEAEANGSTADAVRDRIVGLIGLEQGNEVASAVSHSAGLAVDDSLLAITRYEQRELIARAWERYLAAACSEAPICLLIEDLHWSDPVLLRVLDHVTSGSGTALLGLGTARPEFLQSAQLRPRDGRIQVDLGPLDEAAATRLAELAGGDGDRLSASVDRAAGNPLFLIELARVQLTGSRLPVTVQAAIAARLDELAPEDRELIQYASVAGELFGVHDAVILGDREPADVVAALLRVAQMGFVLPAGTNYRFHHALVRDVVYGRLPVTERLPLHARYAVEGVEAGDVVAQAHHWWDALKPPDAAWVWSDVDRHSRMRREAYRLHLAAGARLEERNAYEEALRVYERAVELAEDTIQRAAAEAEVGRMLARQGRGDDAWAHRLTALELYAEAGETPPAMLFAQMLEPTSFNWGWFRQLPADEEVLRLLDEGERIARATGDDVALAHLLAEHASFTEDTTGSEEFDSLLAAPDPVPFADAAQRMATVYSWAGRIDDALALFDRVFEELIPSGAHINSPEALAWFGRAAFDAGDLAKAERLARELDAESLHRSVHTRSHYFSLVALIAFGRGDWEGLGQAAEALHALAEDHPDESFCVLSASCVGYAGASEMLAGRPLLADLDVQARRQVSESEPVAAAVVLLPKVMAGDVEALERGLAAYQPGVGLWDRIRVWDDADLIPSIAMTMLERWGQVSTALGRLDELAGYGARLAGAAAEAIREEEQAAAGGPPPRHERLRSLGYLGISELLRFRPAAA